MKIFDIDHQNKCPKCGKNMDYIYGKMVCTECGYRDSDEASTKKRQDSATRFTPSSKQEDPSEHKNAFRSTPEKQSNSAHASIQKKANPSAAPNVQPTSTQSTSHTTQPTTYAQSVSHATQPTASTYPGTSDHSSNPNQHWLAIAIITIIAVIIVANVSIISIIRSFSDSTSNTSSNNNNFYCEDISTYSGSHEFPTLTDTDIEQYMELLDKVEETTPSETSSLSKNSSGINRTIEIIFGKNASEITKEELSYVESLNYCYSTEYVPTLEYTLSTSPDSSFYATFNTDEYSMEHSDFSIFPNLTGLFMEYGSVSSLHGMEHLSSLKLQMTPDEISELISPEQIVSLDLATVFDTEDLYGLESFTNLKELSFHANCIDNIDPIGCLTDIEILRIHDSYKLESFEVFYQLSQIQELYLDINNLEDISFLSNMPYITKLTIQDNCIANIHALADISQSLTYLFLDLSNGYEIDNYDVISQCTNLEELYLVKEAINDSKPLPSFADMPNLTTLTLGNFNNYLGLDKAQNLTSLSITDTYLDEYYLLETMPKLTKLELNGISIDQDFLMTLANMKQLETLSLPYCFVEGNFAQLLALPNLKEFRAIWCSMDYDTSVLTLQTNLEVLDLTYCSLFSADFNEHYNSNESFILSECTELFGYFPNLKKLYLSNFRIDSEDLYIIDFIPILTNLEIVDITENPITDLTPLENLSHLRYALCSDADELTYPYLGDKLIFFY